MFKKVVVNGHEYIPVLLVIKKRKVRAKGKEYWHYYINVPRWIGEYFEAEYDEDYRAYPVVALLRSASWYHMLNWQEVGPHLAKEKLPKRIREDLEWLGFL